jgi:hypothetical protein
MNDKRSDFLEKTAVTLQGAALVGAAQENGVCGKCIRKNQEKECLNKIPG